MEWNREISIVWVDRILDSFERMAVTRANYRAAFIADLAMCIGLVALSLYRRDMHLIAALLTFFAGLLLFSLVEYSFHRWLFHGPEHAMERGHRRHHQSPTGIDSLPFFLPPVALLVIFGLLNLAIPTSYAMLLTGAIAGGYFAYGQCHDWIHRTRFQPGLARRWAASHHVHHFHPDRNFGVTSPLWDILLGTRYVSNANNSKR